MNNEDKLQFIAQHYGYDAQSRQCMEECAELIQAINKFWRKGLLCGQRDFTSELARTSHTFNNLVEEMADVLVCIQYIKTLLNIPDEDISEVQTMKLDREISRILAEKR